MSHLSLLGVGSSGPGSSWTPDQAATPLAAWVASDRGSYSAGTVTTLHGQSGTPDLTDRSGDGWTWVPNRYNGRPLFRANSNLSQMWASFALTQPITVYMIVRHRMRKTTQLLYDGGTVNRAAVYGSGTFSDVAAIEYAGGFGPSASTPLGRLGLLKAVFNGASSRMQFNGGTVGTGNPGSTAPNGICLGNGGDLGQTAGAGADYGEVFVYAGDVADGSADDVAATGYVLGKYPANGDNGRSIVCAGDSLTRGYNYAWQSSYPEQLQVLHPTWNVSNYGVDGYTLASSMIGEYAAVVAPAFNANNSANILVVLGGTNDIGIGTSAADTFTALQSYVSTAQGTGWDVRVCTLPAGVYPIGVGSGYNAVRNSYNAMIRANYPASMIIDLGADHRIGDDGDETDATYTQGDLLHRTPAGNGVVAEVAGAKLAT